jgi:hypothetical protein
MQYYLCKYLHCLQMFKHINSSAEQTQWNESGMALTSNSKCNIIEKLDYYAAGLYQVSINFKKSRGHLKILSVRRLTHSKLHIRYTIPSCPTVVHPWPTLLFFFLTVRLAFVIYRSSFFVCSKCICVNLKFFHLIRGSHLYFVFLNVPEIFLFSTTNQYWE